MDLTVERLREILHYDPETGEFQWLRRNSNACKDKVGCVRAAGYLYIDVDGKRYLAQRLAWLWVTGVWPTLVDHIDRNRLNNRWANLRDANKSVNAINSGLHKNNTSGHTGVYWTKGKWRVLHPSGKHLGAFVSKDEAIEIATKARVPSYDHR